MSGDIGEEQKRIAAYLLWQIRGSPIGDDHADWFRAGREIDVARSHARILEKATQRLRESLRRLSKIREVQWRPAIKRKWGTASHYLRQSRRLECP